LYTSGINELPEDAVVDGRRLGRDKVQISTVHLWTTASAGALTQLPEAMKPGAQINQQLQNRKQTQGLETDVPVRWCLQSNNACSRFGQTRHCYIFSAVFFLFGNHIFSVLDGGKTVSIFSAIDGPPCVA
jgi:hypothetical protein